MVTTTFPRPSVDGMGYTVTLRDFNVTCPGRCTARGGDTSLVVKREDPFNWNTTITIAWNGVFLPLELLIGYPGQ